MMKALECMEDKCKKMIPSVINWIGCMEYKEHVYISTMCNNLFADVVTK